MSGTNKFSEKCREYNDPEDKEKLRQLNNYRKKRDRKNKIAAESRKINRRRRCKK